MSCCNVILKRVNSFDQSTTWINCVVLQNFCERNYGAKGVQKLWNKRDVSAIKLIVYLSATLCLAQSYSILKQIFTHNNYINLIARKVTEFRSLRVNCWEINEVKHAECILRAIGEDRKQKMNSPIEFCIFQLVKIPNLCLN